MSYFSKTYEIHGDDNNQDFLLSHYKSQVLQKAQEAGNYCDLLSKFRNLQSEVNNLSNQNLKLKYELKQIEDNSRTTSNYLRKQNEDLLKQISDKEMINRQLFNDNKILNNEIR
jgi:hypothetical protein